MTREENKELQIFLNSIYSRINRAKNAIREMNFGRTEQILSEAYPKLNLKVTE